MKMNKLITFAAVAATICMSEATAANLSDVQIVDGTLTVDTAGEWIVDRDVSCTTLAITADSPVTFVNPSESQTNTITVGTVTSVANANPVFNCKVQFSSTYNVTAESQIIFAGGAKATVPGTVGGTYGQTLTGDIEFTSNWTLGQTGWVVPSGSRLKGKDLTGSNQGYKFTVEAGAYAHFTSVFTGTDAMRLSLNGEMDVDGLLQGGAFRNGGYNGDIGTKNDVGLVRAAGLARPKQKGKNWTGVTLAYIPTYYLGAQGISVTFYKATQWGPLAFAATGGQTIHATANFTASSTDAAETAVRLDTPLTLDTAGHDVTWNAITAGSKVFTKTGAGTLSLCTTNTCTGGIVVDAGTLRVAHEKGLGTGAVTVETGATLEVADEVSATGSFVLKGGTTLAFGDEASIVGPVTLSLEEGEQVTIDAPSRSALLLSGTGLTSADLSKFKLADGVVGTLRLTDDGLLTLGTTYTWVGGTDGKFSTLANWQLPGGDAPKTAPGAGDTVVFAAAAGGAVTNDLDDLSVADISFAAGAGAFTIHGNGISNFAQVDNASANVQTFSNAVEFVAAYRVTAESQIVFAGGATATAPTSDTVGGTYGKTLTGDIEFTSNWTLDSTDWVLTSDSRLKGGDLTGTSQTYKFTVEAGAYAHFTSVFTGTDAMRLSLNGEMDVDGLLQGGAFRNGGYNGDIGTKNDVGLVRAAGLARPKQRGKDWTGVTLAYIPTYYLGAQGISVTFYKKTQWGPLAFAATGGQTIHATADFTVSSTDAAETAIRLDTPLTLDTDGHDVTWNAITGGSKALTKTGAGTLSLNAANTYTGGTVVSNGTVRAAHANGLGTGVVAVETGATLAIADNVSLASSVTLAGGATLDFGSGATVDPAYTIACDGAATVKVVGDFSAMSAGASVTLGALDANVDVKNLVLDVSGSTLPKGMRARLRRDGDNLVLRITKSGFTLIVK